MRMVRLDARPRPAAAPVHLASLHRERDVVTARITAHEAKARAEDPVHHAREKIRVRRRAGASDDQLARIELLEARDPALRPGHAYAHLVVRASDPAELRRLELRTLPSKQRIERDASPDRPERAPVSRRHLVKPVRQPQTSPPRHVLQHHHRLTRQVLPHVAGEQPRVDVVAPADAVADVQVDLFSFVEIRALTERRCNPLQEKPQARSYEYPIHVVPPESPIFCNPERTWT